MDEASQFARKLGFETPGLRFSFTLTSDFLTFSDVAKFVDAFPEKRIHLLTLSKSGYVGDIGVLKDANISTFDCHNGYFSNDNNLSIHISSRLELGGALNVDFELIHVGEILFWKFEKMSRFPKLSFDTVDIVIGHIPDDPLFFTDLWQPNLTWKDLWVGRTSIPRDVRLFARPPVRGGFYFKDIKEEARPFDKSVRLEYLQGPGTLTIPDLGSVTLKSLGIAPPMISDDRLLLPSPVEIALTSRDYQNLIKLTLDNNGFNSALLAKLFAKVGSFPVLQRLTITNDDLDTLPVQIFTACPALSTLAIDRLENIFWLSEEVRYHLRRKINILPGFENYPYSPSLILPFLPLPNVKIENWSKFAFLCITLCKCKENIQFALFSLQIGKGQLSVCNSPGYSE